MPVLSHVRVPARLDNLPEMIQMVTGEACKQGFAPKRLTDIELALEEALVNIINYAYPEQPGDIDVSTAVQESVFTITITDSGIPFDVMSLDEPDLTADISERKVGGLGVFLIRKLMDDVRYRRENERNILELCVNLPS